jgi:hypothetical protein
VNCLALSISSDFWLRWLVHEAWHGIRVQGLEFESWFSQFIVKIVVAPLCVHVLTFSSLVCVHVLTFSSPVWFHVLTFSSPLIRHTWVGVLMCISELPSPFHQFGLLVALASAWSLTKTAYTIKGLQWSLQYRPLLQYTTLSQNRTSLTCELHKLILIRKLMSSSLRWNLYRDNKL